MAPLLEIATFAGKAFVLVAALSVILILISILFRRARDLSGEFEVEDMNETIQTFEWNIKQQLMPPNELKKALKAQKKAEKAKLQDKRPRLFVLDFEGDIRASAAESLREEITALLTVADPKQDEVLLRLESAGGMVHSYGFAASQLDRLRQKGIPLTISVDKVAASGGYMMAVIGNRILAAPFAILGSIGVVAQVPNVHRLLKKYDVDYQEMTAGEYKRTVSLFGEITEGGRAKFMEQLEDTHQLFKQFIGKYRPHLDLSTIATGETWLGERALHLGLVDEIRTSDDYIFHNRETKQILRLQITEKQKWTDRLSGLLGRISDRVSAGIMARMN